MYKNSSYKEKHAILKEWMPDIISSIKSDLKNDHLKRDPIFVKQYFPQKNIQQIGIKEMVEGYNSAIENSDAGERVAEFIATRWIFKNTDVYDSFEKELSKLTSDFTQLERIESEPSREIIQNVLSNHSAMVTYCFSVWNSVVFCEEAFEELRKRAEKELSQKLDQEKEAEKKASREAEEKAIDQLEREIVRLTDKYEKRLAGFQRKYEIDTAALKKQVASLQRQLAR